MSNDAVLFLLAAAGVLFVGLGFGFDSIMIAASGALMCFTAAFCIAANEKHADEIQACTDAGLHAVTREIPVGQRFVACVEEMP